MCQTIRHKLDFWGVHFGSFWRFFDVLNYKPADMEPQFKFNKPFWRTSPWTFCFHHEN